MSARFVRQVLVSEIGASGQRAIERASAELVAEGLTGEVFRTYAAGAGFGDVQVHPPLDREPGEPASGPRATTAVLEGARAAVRAITATLDAERARIP